MTTYHYVLVKCNIYIYKYVDLDVIQEKIHSCNEILYIEKTQR